MSLAKRPPTPYTVHFQSIAARNSCPSALRQEGMIAYVAANRITYQLNQPPWDGTNNDWSVFSALNPYAIPVFSLFNMTGVGTVLIEGASVSGSVTFTWGTTDSQNVAVNSISITDVENSVVLASGLADDGSQTITLPTPITETAGHKHTWRITGLDTKGNPFSRDLQIAWVAASNKTWYVRTNGNDANTGQADNAGGAFLTLQKLANAITASGGPGDTAHIRAGTYAGFVLGWDTPIAGASGYPIRFLADSGVIVNHRNNQTFDAIDVESCSYITIDGFSVQNDGTVTRAGIRVSGGGDGNIISNNSVDGIGRFGILTGFLKAFTITRNTVTNIQSLSGQNTGHGIYSANAGDDGDITYNIVTGCGGDGIHSNGDLNAGGIGVQSNLRIHHNIISGCNKIQGGAAIDADGLVSSHVYNNLIYKEHSAGIAIYQIDAAHPSSGNLIEFNAFILAADSPKGCVRIANGAFNNTVRNNILWPVSTLTGAFSVDGDCFTGMVSDYNLLVSKMSDNGGDSYTDLATWRSLHTLDAHSIIMSSLASVFNAPASDDYTLALTSPAINAGLNTNAPSDDLAGTTRPQGATVDIGPYESPDRPVIIARSPLDGATNVSSSTTVTYTMDRAIASGMTFSLKDNSNNTVAGNLVTSDNIHYTFTPTSSLTDTHYTVHVSGATDAGGHTMTAATWQFYTVAVPETAFVDQLGHFDNSGVWAYGNENFYNNNGPNSGFLGNIFQTTVACKITKIPWWKYGDTETSHHFYVFVKNGAGLTPYGPFVSTGEGGNLSYNVLTLGSPVTLQAGDMFWAGYYKTEPAVPHVGLIADGNGGDYFFVVHSPWTNTTGHLICQGTPYVNGAVIPSATETLPTLWSDFATAAGRSLVGVDVVIEPS